MGFTELAVIVYGVKLPDYDEKSNAKLYVKIFNSLLNGEFDVNNIYTNEVMLEQLHDGIVFEHDYKLKQYVVRETIQGTFLVLKEVYELEDDVLEIPDLTKSEIEKFIKFFKEDHVEIRPESIKKYLVKEGDY
jgi:hypothetical protein